MNPESNFQIQYQNQLQFNLNVPVTTDKLAVQFQRPQPIFIERISGLHSLPGKVKSKPSENFHIKKDASLLLEDKMSAMIQLARRDIQKGNLLTQISFSSDGPVTKNQLTSSPKHTFIPQHKSSVRCQRHHHPITNRETEKNRIFGAVQTPPPQKPKVVNDSVEHFDKNMSCLGTSQNELSRLILEMLNYFQILQNFLERAVSTDCTEFLTPVTKGKHKDGFLYQEETTSRSQLRAEEHKTRCIRTVYNLTQKVRQLQKELLNCDLNNAVKKNHMITQVIAIYRGAAKAHQMFMNQLPFQKLESGLPSHYQDLSLLIRSLIGLDHVPDKENFSDQHKSLEMLMNNIDNLNSKWCMKNKQKVTFADKKTIGQTWVSDTKVDKNIFLIKDKPTSSLVQKKPGNKGSQNVFHEQHKLLNKGKENIFVKSKRAQTSGSTNKQKQRPATASRPKGIMMTDKTAFSNKKSFQCSSRNTEDIVFKPGKSAVSIQKYETKGTSDLHLNTNSPFYVQNLSNEDMREIFQYKSHSGNVSYDSSCTTEGSQFQSKDSINSDIKESKQKDMTVNSKIDIFDEEDVNTIQSDAAAMCDLPTLENIKLRLVEMQREKLEIQQRWSSFKFISSSQKLNSESGKISSKETDIYTHLLPKANNVKDDITDDPFGRLIVKEPILFTKPVTRPAPHHLNLTASRQQSVSLLHEKTLLKLKQTSVEKILQNQQQFDKYLKSISHHPSGKFNPWLLIEELSDEILHDCLQDVASEIEEINHEIAQEMFTSEFLVEKSPSSEYTLQNGEEKFDLEHVDDNHFDVSILRQEKFEKSESSKSQPQIKVMDQPQSKVMDQPQSKVMDQPQSKVMDQPQSKVMDQPQSKVMDQPQSKVMDQPQSKVMDQPQSKVMDQPQSKVMDQPQSKVMDQPQSKVWTTDVSVLNLRGETTVMFLDDVHHMDSVSVSSVESKQGGSFRVDKQVNEVEEDRSESIHSESNSDSMENKDRNDSPDEKGRDEANIHYSDESDREDSNSYADGRDSSHEDSIGSKKDKIELNDNKEVKDESIVDNYSDEYFEDSEEDV